MPNCPNCGIVVNTDFCPNCGTQISSDNNTVTSTDNQTNSNNTTSKSENLSFYKKLFIILVAAIVVVTSITGITNCTANILKKDEQPSQSSMINYTQNDNNDNSDYDNNDDDSKYLGIWISYPFVAPNFAYAYGINIKSYDGKTVDFEYYYFNGTLYDDQTIDWSLNTKNDDTEEKTATVKLKNGVPVFDLYEDYEYTNKMIYLDDDVLYYEEYGKKDYSMHLSDFSGINTCLKFFNDAYFEYETETTSFGNLTNKDITIKRVDVSDYSESDYTIKYEPDTITEKDLKPYAETLYKQLEEKIKKEKKNYSLGTSYLVFSIDKEFSDDIVDLDLELCVEATMKKDEKQEFKWINVWSTGKKFENYTVYDEDDEDFDEDFSPEIYVDIFEGNCVDYIQVPSNPNLYYFDDNQSDDLEYVYKYKP